MQLVSTTPLAAILFVTALWLGASRGIWTLFFSFPLGAAAAVNLAGIGSISLTDFVILGLWCTVLWSRLKFGHILATLRFGEPGFPMLLLVLWATIGAVFLPRVFAGMTDVFVTLRYSTGAANVLMPLTPVGGNINQLMRLILAMSIFPLLAAEFARTGAYQYVRQGMYVATSLHIIVATLNLGSIAVGRPDLLDFIRTAQMAMLDNQAFMGVPRLAGGFPEPSAFGAYTIGLYGYWLRDWFGVNRSRYSGFFLSCVVLLILRSTSSSTYVSFAIVTLFFVTFQFGKALRNRRAFILYYMAVVGVPLLCGLIVLAWNFFPMFPTLVDRILLNKLSSESGMERMSWNQQAIANFIQSWGAGVGIGSVRASSWIVATLGSLGAIGTGLYLWFISTALTNRGMQSSTLSDCAAATQFGATAILIQACLSKPFPNLDVPFFTMCGLATGILVHARRQQHQRHLEETT